MKEESSIYRGDDNGNIKAVFASCKIFSENAIFGKGKYFQVFGYIMKIFLENIFMCLVIF